MENDTPVTEFMTTDVLVVQPDDPIEQAVTQFAERNITGAPVVDQDGRYVGLVDDSDIVLSSSRVHAPSMVEILGIYFPVPGAMQKFEDEVRHALATTVSDVMQTDAPPLGSDATLTDVASAMNEHDVSRVTILDAEGRVVGLVSRHNLVAALSRAF